MGMVLSMTITGGQFMRDSSGMIRGMAGGGCPTLRGSCVMGSMKDGEGSPLLPSTTRATSIIITLMASVFR